MDDGVRSMDEALKMAAIAFADGIEQMVCTPHMFNGLSKDPLTSEIEDRVSELQNAIGGTGLKVLPGSEVRVTSGFVTQAQENLFTALNRKTYVLVEFPTPSVPRGARLWFKNLKLQGVNPILAHPERNLEIQRYPWIAADFVGDGVLTQVTAMSVAGQFGTAAKMRRQPVASQLRALLATDTHRPEKRHAVLSRGRDSAAAIIGMEAARILVEDNPLAVVTGEPIVPPAVIPYEKPAGVSRSFFGRLFRR